MRKRYDFDQVANQPDLDFNFDPKNRHSIHSVPFYVGLTILAGLGALFGIVYGIDTILPTPLNLADEINYPDRFIAERARNDLKLLSELGPRIVGSYENEILTVDYLTREINFIIQQANKNQKLELDVQTVTGAYYLGIKIGGTINAYSNVQNIIVKFHGLSNSSLLVNSHFDSVPTSPGGSDDGINVVAMLEILRKLSRKPTKPKNNIIFLFNGAEETVLQAAHGFITQHKWAQSCKALINLEACGHGGKQILFQTGPKSPLMLEHYSKVPHPYGQVAGEELFQSGIIPSDTDFRIFRDYGGLVGLDFAFFKNGYRYHTKHDNEKDLDSGSFQHVGDNILQLVKSLSEAQLDQAAGNKDMVYFDVFGLFISYNKTVAAFVNSFAIALSLLAFLLALRLLKLGQRKQMYKYLSISLGYILLGWVCSGAAVFFIAFILDCLNSSMSWFSNPWLIFCLYCAPIIACSSTTLYFINHENLSLNVRSQIQAHIVRLIWSFVLLLLTAFGIRSSYAFVPLTLFGALAFVLIYLFKWQHSVRKWQVLYVTFMIIPTMLLMYQANITFSLFVPLTGRIGSDKNPETLIAAITLLLCLLTVSPFVALVTLVRDRKYFFGALGLVFVAGLICTFTINPYGSSAPTPQRHWVMHTSRVFHNEEGKVERTDSGIFMLNLDRNSPRSLRSFVKDLSKAKDLQDCKKYVLCGLPLSHAKMIQIMQYSTWVPAGQPVIHLPVTVSHSKQLLSDTSIRYKITAGGPDRIGIYIVPKEGVTVKNITLIEELPQNTFEYNGRPVYFILHVWGKTSVPISFEIDVEVDHSNRTVLDVAVTSVHVHDKRNVKTPYFKSFLDQFPEWTDVTPYLATYNAYVL